MVETSRTIEALLDYSDGNIEEALELCGLTPYEALVILYREGHLDVPHEYIVYTVDEEYEEE